MRSKAAGKAICRKIRSGFRQFMPPDDFSRGPLRAHTRAKDNPERLSIDNQCSMIM
jgi:hypothetical protein